MKKNQTHRPTAPQSEAAVTQKKPYTPPKVTFVPMEVEERTLACYKVDYHIDPYCGHGCHS